MGDERMNRDAVDRLAYSPAAAAEALDICRAQVYRLIQAGELRTINIGRSRRIPRSELERLVARGVTVVGHTATTP